MANDPSRDLERWIPHLLAVWRAHRQQRQRAGGGGRDHGGRNHRGHHHHGSAAPEDRLLPDELQEVVSGVKTLSHGLTRDRNLAGARYMDDPKLLGAYLLFYWPVSYAQGRSLLGELHSTPRSVLDLGSGPGPVAFAASDAGAREVIAADRSNAALELAKKLAAQAGEALSTREWSPERTLPEGTYDVITMGHVINELFNGNTAQRATLLEKIATKLKPNGTLLVLEPALRETSRALLEVRDLLVQKGYAVRAPCLFRGACPALIKGSDWCHAERAWRMPSVVESIARGVGLHKEALKMSYLMIAPHGESWAAAPAGQVFRIVSEPLEGKGRQRYMGCGPDGRIGLALQEKHETAENKKFFSLKRGDVVRVTDTEPRGDGVTLTGTSKLEMVAYAGGAVPRESDPSVTKT